MFGAKILPPAVGSPGNIEKTHRRRGLSFGKLLGNDVPSSGGARKSNLEREYWGIEGMKKNLNIPSGGTVFGLAGVQK